MDEIDKVSTQSHNGNIQATLLGMLKRETSEAFFDEFLMAPADLSQVSWIMTANDISYIPISSVSGRIRASWC